MRPLILLYLLASASAFPAMLFERLLPVPPAPSAIAWQPGKGWYHNAKNWTTESVRADAQWWSKGLCFGVVAGSVLAFAAGHFL